MHWRAVDTILTGRQRDGGDEAAGVQLRSERACLYVFKGLVRRLVLLSRARGGEGEGFDLQSCEFAQ